MKDKIINFLKDKFNIALVAIQVLAILSYFLSSKKLFFVITFFVFESIFFVAWGVKLLLKARNNKDINEIYNQLPYGQQTKIRIQKQNELSNKNNKFMGIALIILGLILIISLFSMLF